MNGMESNDKKNVYRLSFGSEKERYACGAHNTHTHTPPLTFGNNACDKVSVNWTWIVLKLYVMRIANINTKSILAEYNINRWMQKNAIWLVVHCRANGKCKKAGKGDGGGKKWNSDTTSTFPSKYLTYFHPKSTIMRPTFTHKHWKNSETLAYQLLSDSGWNVCMHFRMILSTFFTIFAVQHPFHPIIPLATHIVRADTYKFTHTRSLCRNFKLNAECDQKFSAC